MRKMPREVQNLMRVRLEQIARDPYTLHPNVTKLQNREGYRLRVGDWRLIYDIQNDQLSILVLKVEPRGEVYR